MEESSPKNNKAVDIIQQTNQLRLSNSDNIRLSGNKIADGQQIITSKDGTELWCKSWKPDDSVETKSVVTFVHGLGEHCSRYEHVFKTFAQHGIRVHAFDHSNHGNSPLSPRRSEKFEFENYINDLDSIFQRADDNLPQFIMGSSQGCVLILHYVLDRLQSSDIRLEGIVCSSPILSKLEKSAITKSITKIKSKLSPKSETKSSYNDKRLSRNPENMKSVQEDKLMQPQLKVEVVSKFSKLGEKLVKLGPKFKIPLLILSGEDDKIADKSLTNKFYQKIATSDKKWVNFPKLFHDILNEPERDEVIKTAYEWILEHSNGKVNEKSEKSNENFDIKKDLKNELSSESTKKEIPIQENSPKRCKETSEETSDENSKNSNGTEETVKVDKSDKSITKEKEKETLRDSGSDGQGNISAASSPVSKKVVEKKEKKVVPGKRTAVDFEFGRVLGEGAFGEVKYAKEIKTGQEFAVKMLNKKHILDSKKEKYVHTERNIFNSLSHPNAVKLWYTFQDPINLYYVLELCPNGDLGLQLKMHTKFNEEIVRFYTAQIVSVLEHMHSKGIVHRDLKPDNILLDPQFHVKLTDFGTSKIIGTEIKARSNSFCGTEAYVSPELLDENDPCASKSSDLWALGIIVYQLLTGRVPFKGETAFKTFEKIKLREITYTEDDHVSDTAKDFINQLLSLEPEERLGAKGYQDLKAHSFFTEIDFSNLTKMVSPLKEFNSQSQTQNDQKDQKEQQKQEQE